MDLKDMDHATEPEPGITYEGDVLPNSSATDVDISMLSADQLPAYEIIKSHFAKSASQTEEDQLLMQIQGEGGTGKSIVISKITELFQAHGRQAELRKPAYTGIAASLIGGSTLHQLAILHQVSKPSRKSVERLQKTWDPVKYLVIDEVSMVSKKTLADISEMISIGKQRKNENHTTIPFGGVNVILAGDFHQFPPVVGTGKGRRALYAPSCSSHGIKAGLGCDIYLLFTEVVILKQQF